MRTTVTLDDDVFEAAQRLALASGMSVGQVLSDLARRGLRQPAAGAVSHTRRRFPGFAVPEDAPVITGSRVQQALDQEGRG